MKSAARIALANGLMGAGLAPMVLWLAMLANSMSYLRRGEFGLPDLMFAGVAGMGAYLFALLVAGAGAIWAATQVRAAATGARRIAKALILLTAAFLLLPWLAVGTLVAARYFE